DPAGEFHGPGETEVNDESAVDGAGAGRKDAEEQTAEERGDAFAQWFAEMDGTIEGGHGQDGVGAGETEQGYNEQAAEEELDAEEVQSIRDLIKQFPGPGGVGDAIEKGQVVQFGIDQLEIMLGGGECDQGQGGEEQEEVGAEIRVAAGEAYGAGEAFAVEESRFIKSIQEAEKQEEFEGQLQHEGGILGPWHWDGEGQERIEIPVDHLQGEI